MEDMNQAQQGKEDPSSRTAPLERKPSEDEDPAVMTIEFLRARLLSERSVSKAARQRAQLLAKKVTELEERLEAEIQLRKKLEADRWEILLKYRAELSDEHIDFCPSNFGESFTRDGSTLDSLNVRKNDSPNKDDQGMPSSTLEWLGRNESSQHLNCEDANDEDAETNHLLWEKGVLSWGRQKGSRKEFGYRTGWLGRSFSQRLLTSTDGESPQKKWVGKSVRQFRQKYGRQFDTSFEGEHRQIQACEDSDGKIGQPRDIREHLPCEDERDTEVERVLEQQAELIEQYEAEENAQRAWEANFKERKALIDHENIISPSNSTHKADTVSSSSYVEKESVAANDDATNLVKKASHLLNHFSNDTADLNSKPEETTEGQNKSETPHRFPLPDIVAINVPSENAAPCFSVDQNRVSLLEGSQPREEITEAIQTSEVRHDSLSHGPVSPITETQQSKEQSVQPTVDVGRRGRYNKHLSSSFRFAVFSEGDEQEAGSSPQMQGFTRYKHDASKGESSDLNKLSEGASGQVSISGSSHAVHLDFHNDDMPAALPDDHTRANCVFGEHDATREGRESQDKGKDLLDDEIPGMEKLSAFENGFRGCYPNVNASCNMESNSSEEELNRGMKGVGGVQDISGGIGRPLLESQLHVEPKGPAGSEYLQRHHPDLSHIGYDVQPPRDADGATFDHLALYPGYRSRIEGPPRRATAYEENALSSNLWSMDGFDRVADVLRALQIAKLQIQCAKEEVAPGNDGNDDGGRGAYCAEAPRLPPYAARNALYTEAPRLDPPLFPPVYGTDPLMYATSVTYSSRGPPYVHNIHGLDASGYGIGSSRLVPSASYMQYPSQIPETHNLWPKRPSSHGVYDGNLHQYDERQHRWSW